MNSFLSRFKSAIGTVQTEQLVRLLTKKRNTGEIRSVQEFSQNLEELIRDLRETGLKPSITIPAIEADNTIFSSQHNTMLEALGNDLEAGFTEANQIDEVQQAHRAIVRDLLLKNLKDSISEIEDRISAFEKMRGLDSGFATLISSTFREAAESRTTMAAQSSLSFTDPRRPISALAESQVDLVGERLELDYESYTYHRVHGIRMIFDDEATYSDISVEPYGSELTNVIDGQKKTYFLLNQLFVDSTRSVTNKLELDLGGEKSIDFIEIEPALLRPIYITKVEYLDRHQNWIVLLDDPIELLTAISIPTKSFVSTKLRFTFTNYNSMPMSFEYDTTTKTLFQHYLSRDPLERVDMSSVSTELNTLLASSKIKEIIGITVPVPSEFTGHSFLFGMDNIRVGTAAYRDRSIYMSTALDVPANGILGLEVVENRPYLLDDEVSYTNTTYNLDSGTDPFGNLVFVAPDDVVFLGSVEYWVLKEDIKNDRVVKFTRFPILPMGVEHIYHERLVLTEKTLPTDPMENQGCTMFYTVPDDPDYEFKLYKNGVQVAYINAELQAMPGLGSPMRCRITVPSPQPGDIFTVSYLPIISTTYQVPKTLEEVLNLDGLKVVDLVGDLSVRPHTNQIVIFEAGDVEQAPHDESRLYLTVIFRRNTHNKSLSPSLEEYTLMSGYLNSSKWQGVK